MEPQPNRPASAERPPVAYYVLGAGRFGAAIAHHLEAAGHAVRLIDEAQGPDDRSGFRADPEDVAALEAAGVADASTVIVATDEDSRNMLIAQKVRTHFDVPRVLVLVHDPDRCDLFEDIAHEPICVSTTLSNALVDQVSSTPTRPEATE